MKIVNNLPKLREDDTANSIVTYDSVDTIDVAEWTDVDVLESGEKHRSLFKKISTMFKNIRYIFKKLGTTDISAIGDGTVTGGISSLNENFNNYLPLSGGEVTGATTFDEYTVQKKTQYAHVVSVGGGSNGYIKFATVTYTHGANLDWLIEFEFIQRGFAEKGTLDLLLNNSDYTVKSFILNGTSQDCYYVRTTTDTTSVIDLYIYKSGAWDCILFTSIKDFAKNPAILYSVEWKNEFVSSLPSGYVRATRALNTQTIVVNSYATIYKTGNVCQLQFNGLYDSTFTFPDNCLPLGTQRGVVIAGKGYPSTTNFSREFVNVDMVRNYKTTNIWRYDGNPSSSETALTITDGYNLYGCITYICG